MNGALDSVEVFEANSWSVAKETLLSKRQLHAACTVLVQRDVLLQRIVELLAERRRRQRVAGVQ